MSRRLLSSAVPLRGITLDATAAARLPSEEAVADALRRLTRDLEDMRIARTAGGEEWVGGDFTFRIVEHADDGSQELRGFLEIERAD